MSTILVDPAERRQARNTDPAPYDRVALAPETAQRAVDAADLRALLMMVFHHTGDRYWLTDRFQPTRDVRLIAPEDAGLPEHAQQELREAAVAILCDTSEPAVTAPDDALLQEMMCIALGERVPAEYVPMMREQMGLAPPLGEIRRVSGSTQQNDLLPVLIVGAGESAIALGAMLDDLGIDYLIMERAENLGGTWRDNIYPGCAVDTPNHSYSYSFGTRYPWTRFFSERMEIQDYLQQCADEFRIRERVQFNTTVVQAIWDEKSSTWRVLLESDGERRWVHTRFLVSAIGPFGEPQMPSIEGLESFRGSVMHSARWPKDLDLSGKSVAIIGTGASCMQIAPAIVDEVAQLSIFQRTPQWVRPIPRFHDRIDDAVQVLLQRERYYSCWYRFVMLWRYGDGLLATLRVDPDWPHPERSVNKNNDRHREQMTRHIRAALADRPDLIAKCLPDYPPYGKRILLDNDWYETLLKPNVHLVTDAIANIAPTGVRLDDGSLVEADVLVLATGFDVSRNAARLDIRGRNGLSLADKWAGGVAAYLGITIPDFPNLFVIQGPTTGLAHGGSAIFISEAQSRYIALAIHQALTSGVSALDVKSEKYDEYMARVDDEHDHLVWNHPGVRSYYQNAFGRVRMVLAWRMVDYFAMTRHPDFGDFNLVKNGQAP